MWGTLFVRRARLALGRVLHSKVEWVQIALQGLLRVCCSLGCRVWLQNCQREGLSRFRDVNGKPDQEKVA